MSFRVFNPRYKPVWIAHKLFEAPRGSNKKTPVIFLHGLLERKETWGQVPQLVASLTNRKVYAYDARNHGESELTMDCNFDYNLYDLYHFLNEVKVYKAILVGNNVGGITAIGAALQNPHIIEGIFVLDMHVGKLSEEMIKNYLKFMQAAAVNLHDVPDGCQRPNLALVRIPPPLEKSRETGLLRSVLAYRLLALMDALMQYDKTPLIYNIGEFHGPAYFLCGSESLNRVGDNADKIKERFPEAEILMFEGAKENLHTTHPHIFLNTIVERLPKRKFFGFF